MAKKRRHVIPDFSSKRPGAKGFEERTTATHAPPAPPAPRIKPQATSAKSGRRGG